MTGWGQERRERGLLWSGVTAKRDKLLAAEFEGAFLEISCSVVDCVLSLPKNYKLASLWPSELCRHKQTVGYFHGGELCSPVFPKSVLKYLPMFSLGHVDWRLLTFWNERYSSVEACCFHSPLSDTSLSHFCIRCFRLIIFRIIHPSFASCVKLVNCPYNFKELKNSVLWIGFLLSDFLV